MTYLKRSKLEMSGLIYLVDAPLVGLPQLFFAVVQIRFGPYHFSALFTLVCLDLPLNTIFDDFSLLKRLSGVYMMLS